MPGPLGPHGQAVNVILAYLASDAHVSNADTIALDGALGTDFETALAQLKREGRTHELVRLLREQLRLVSTEPARYGPFAPEWDPTYDRFVEYLTRCASLECDR